MARASIISTYGLLMDLVAIDVQQCAWEIDRRFGTSCQRRAIFFSPLQGCTRHALPSPENGQYHHQPHINCFSPVEYWQNTPKLSVVRLSIGIWWS
jgi:hypothetical protein